MLEATPDFARARASSTVKFRHTLPNKNNPALAGDCLASNASAGELLITTGPSLCATNGGLTGCGSRVGSDTTGVGCGVGSAKTALGGSGGDSGMASIASAGAAAEGAGTEASTSMGCGSAG